MVVKLIWIENYHPRQYFYLRATGTHLETTGHGEHLDIVSSGPTKLLHQLEGQHLHSECPSNTFSRLRAVLHSLCTLSLLTLPAT